MIHTLPLFPVLDAKLIELLRSLSPDEWNKPTIARLWTVKDIATHLLDGNLRTLSFSRDKHSIIPDREINSYESLVDYLNQLNADWVKATKRLSPEILIELLESSGKQYSQYLTTLDPHAEAIFSVAWAGEQTSKNWFHIAREYTEKWHHQQQIRAAVGKPGIMTRELFYPFIETLLRGLPHVYRNTAAAEGTTIQITIDSSIGDSWYLQRENGGWKLLTIPNNPISSQLVLGPDTAWKIFTKGMDPSTALDNCRLSGNTALGQVALNLVAVMA